MLVNHLSQKYQIISTNQDNNLRIDKFVTIYMQDEILGLSRSKAKNLILSSRVTVNGSIVVDPAFIVKEDDLVEVVITDEVLDNDGEEDIKPKDIKLDIVFEDDDLLVINKQAGLASHPGAGNYDNSLVNALLYYCPDSLSTMGGMARPGIVHRLDKDTTGLMVVAKNDYAHQHLAQQIQSREFSRSYYAIIWGVIHPDEGVIENNIGRNPRNRKIMGVVKNGGKVAITHYEVQEIYKDNMASLVKCQLETGRTHQIRVHMSNIGHSLVGDQTYGKNEHKIVKYVKNQELYDYLNQFKRQALHSAEISFEHPRSGELMEFDVDFPQDMLGLLELLR